MDNTIFKFNGNVRNFNLIDNLPYGCCVEVPVVASKVFWACAYDPLTSAVLSLDEIQEMVNESGAVPYQYCPISHTEYTCNVI